MINQICISIGPEEQWRSQKYLASLAVVFAFSLLFRVIKYDSKNVKYEVCHPGSNVVFS
jgi:hypothetical protein